MIVVVCATMKLLPARYTIVTLRRKQKEIIDMLFDLFDWWHLQEECLLFAPFYRPHSNTIALQAKRKKNTTNNCAHKQWTIDKNALLFCYHSGNEHLHRKIVNMKMDFLYQIFKIKILYFISCHENISETFVLYFSPCLFIQTQLSILI